MCSLREAKPYQYVVQARTRNITQVVHGVREVAERKLENEIRRIVLSSRIPSGYSGLPLSGWTVRVKDMPSQPARLRQCWRNIIARTVLCIQISHTGISVECDTHRTAALLISPNVSNTTVAKRFASVSLK